MKQSGKLDNFFLKNHPSTSQNSTETEENNIGDSRDKNNVQVQDLIEVRDGQNIAEHLIVKNENATLPTLLSTSSNEDKIEAEQQPTSFSADPADWKIINDELIENVVSIDTTKFNKNWDFSKSKRIYSDTTRYLNESAFSKILLNGEKQYRSYLNYSTTAGKLYCVPCKLFGGKSAFAGTGFNDWKNIANRLVEHENSSEHKECIMVMVHRKNINKHIDLQFRTQHKIEVDYWRNVLKRVVAVVKALSMRGLPFRGASDKFGSCHSGLFIMSMELIAEFDPFLADHIKKHGNAGKGSTSYLSFNIYEQFINLMADEVLNEIIKRIIQGKYFSVIVDSTPDISHTDQLSFVIRYVTKNGPEERFIKFLPNAGHKSAEMEKVVVDTINDIGLDISNLRGQSYDNAANMSGAYSGLQARLKTLNPLAEYAPCAAHSLNLIGISASESCLEAVKFFDFLQNLFVFFSASTHRWDILEQCKVSLSIKRATGTRWSAKAEACRSLVEDWAPIVEALTQISGDVSQKPITKNEAVGLLKQLERLETFFMAGFWDLILKRFKLVSQKLQNKNMDVDMVVELYESLIQFLMDTRTQYEFFEEQAKEKCPRDFNSITGRQKNRKLVSDESRNNEVTLTGSDLFRVSVFNVILDNMLSEFRKRLTAYKNIMEKYGFLTKILDLSNEQIVAAATHLCNIFERDIDKSFVDECIYLKSYLKNQQLNNSIPQKISLSELFSLIIVEKNLQSIFPYLEIVLRIFLSTPATNCTAERSFSTLKRVKNYLRSTTSDKRLNSLAIMAIESDIVRELDFEKIIDLFANQKSRKKKFE